MSAGIDFDTARPDRADIVKKLAPLRSTSTIVD